MLVRCKFCKSEFRAYPSDIRKGKRFCSIRCAVDAGEWGPKGHGGSYTRLYQIWIDMKNRCYCKSSPNYKYYGQRGISVCRKWRESFVTFREWAVKSGYAGHLELDRRLVNGNYEPRNCRWVTRIQQMRNTRKRNDADRTSKFKGVGRCLSKVNPWRATINLNGKPRHIGVFATEIAAALAYDRMALVLFGDFSCLNFPRKECATF